MQTTVKAIPKNKAVMAETETASIKTLNSDDTSNSQVLKQSYHAPEHCPKFQTCNAPICPLDANWDRRTHHSEDASCFYLIESVKHNAQANFEVALPSGFYQTILTARSNILVRHTRLNYILERAKLTGSRMVRKVGVIHE